MLLEEWMLSSEAWKSLKPGPVALYVQLKRRFNGGNNGRIFLSHREAANTLNVGRDTVSRYFNDLIERGFIAVTKGHCLGPEGVGKSAHYRLTEAAYESKPATKDFMNWRQSKKQKPHRKIQHPMAGKSNRGCRKNQPSEVQMSENPTAFGRNGASPVLENPAIYTSNHIPLTVREVEQRLMHGLGLCGNAVTQVASG